MQSGLVFAKIVFGNAENVSAADDASCGQSSPELEYIFKIVNNALTKKR